MPTTIITEENLLDILNENLLELNLHNHNWIKNDLLNKIGYFAPNIKSITLSMTEIDDEVLNELAISCEKLEYIDISKCPKLT